MPGIKRDFYNVCPFCWSVLVKRRVFKSPKYLCEVCGNTFNQKKTISHNQRKLFNNLLKEARMKPYNTFCGLRCAMVDTVKRKIQCEK